MYRTPGRLSGKAFDGGMIRSERRPSGRRRAGSILPLICLSLVSLLGLMALSIDLGSLSNVKANMQNATDAAALAGAGNLTTAQTAQDAAALWYLANMNQSTTQPSGSGTTSRTYTISGDTVVVTTPYSDATTTAQGWPAANLVQVRATRTVPLYFAPAVGVPSATVAARAVALASTGGSGNWPGGEGCLFATNGFSLACSSLTVKGSLYSNSNLSMAISYLWIGDILHAETSVVLSGSSVNGGFNLQYGTTYTVASSSANIASYTKTPQTAVTPPITYIPANYNTDFNVGYVHTSSWTISASNYTFAPGTYYVNGNMNISGSNINATGCTFIVNGNFTCSASNATFSPDPKGLKAGGTNYMCIYDVATNGTISIAASDATVDGDVYAPNGTISCASSKLQEGWWVASHITIAASTFELDGIPGRGGGSATYKLVE